MSTIAAGIRAHAPTAVPFRLLLPPLLGHWQAAVQRGPKAAGRLLVVLTAMLGSADAKVVAPAADPVFGFLLRALDTRQQPPDGFGPEGECFAVSARRRTVRSLVSLIATCCCYGKVLVAVFVAALCWVRSFGSFPCGRHCVWHH